MREVASEGRKSFPHHLAIGEAGAGTGVREVEVADGAAVVFQMTQEAWILGENQILRSGSDAFSLNRSLSNLGRRPGQGLMTLGR